MASTARPSQTKKEPRLILLNKPFGVLCQFSPDGSGKPTLKDYVGEAEVYPAGRLDTDSEGLLALTDYGPLQARIAQPENKLPKTYWVQVEGTVDEAALQRLALGVMLKDGLTQPAVALALSEPDVWERTPKIRERKAIPTSWLELTIREGRNRQVRRMTAAVGFPTLRLIRVRIGPFGLDGLGSGQSRPVPWASVLASLGPLPLPRSRPTRASVRGRRGAGPPRRRG